MKAAPDVELGDDPPSGPTTAIGLALPKAGERRTPFRQAILDLLAGSGRPMSAYAVAEALGREQRRKVAASAVDPVLRFFETRGIVRRIDTVRAYMIVPDPGANACYVCLWCTGCKRATLVREDGLAGRLEALARSREFNPHRTIIEVVGICAACRGPAGSEESS